MEWQEGQRATASLRLGSINRGGVLRLMPASPTEGGEAPAHAVPSAPITLDVNPVEESCLLAFICIVILLPLGLGGRVKERNVAELTTFHAQRKSESMIIMHAH